LLLLRLHDGTAHDHLVEQLADQSERVDLVVVVLARLRRKSCTSSAAISFLENRNSASAGRSRHPSALAPHSAFPRSPPVFGEHSFRKMAK
jgi:hypothetical protein